LKRIEAYKRTEISEAKVRVPLATLERKAHDHDPTRGFLRALEAKVASGGGRQRVAAGIGLRRSIGYAFNNHGRRAARRPQAH
jgi:hypothetical protein